MIDSRRLLCVDMICQFVSTPFALFNLVVLLCIILNLLKKFVIGVGGEKDPFSWDCFLGTDIDSSRSEADSLYLFESTESSQNDDFPRTDQLGYIQHLVSYLKEVVEFKGESIYELKHNILELQKELTLVVSNFLKISKSCREMSDFKDILSSITSLAYQAEYVVDSVLAGDSPIQYGILDLANLISKMYRKSKLVQMASGHSESFVSDIPFGIPKDLLVIPLVQTEGSQNLVSNIIDTQFAQIVFNVSPWCTIPENFYDKENEPEKSVYLSRVKGISYLKSVDECVEVLRILLKNRRYILVLWNVRVSEVLLDILRSLPDDKNGSRVVVVTPAPELALQIRRHAYRDLLLEMLNEQPSSSQTKETNDRPSVKGEMVGFKDEEMNMLGRLLGGTRQPQLQIVSIFGMAGQGKTTLANKLYNHTSLADYFHVRAWCYVSQVYQTRELLLELLSQIIVKESNKLHDKSNYDLSELLFKNLKGRRYLIVMDDLWDTRAWEDLKRCFPNDNNGSRIIFTTRIQELARQARSDSVLQPLCPLSDDECWELLEKKIFLKESCPSELEMVGRKIAKSCNGLPLSVVLTSGLLLRMDKKADEWEHIAESLSSQILEDPEAECPGILELSYKHLPDHLKPCLLYLGAFLEDRAIPVRKITRIWIAEGFVNSTQLESLEENSQLESSEKIAQSQTLEDVAEGYLMELIYRSLVLIATGKSKGGVKACRVHDLLRSFCLMKAKEENFLHQSSGSDEHFSSSENHIDQADEYLIDQNSGLLDFHFLYHYHSKLVRYEIRRLCIYSENNRLVMSKRSCPGVRSLLFFSISDMFPSCPHDVVIQFFTFKLLKILDLEDINIGSLFWIDRLVLLRYFAFQTDADCIPSSIAKLWNLETLIVKGVGTNLIKVPDSIWDMVKLRHLDINSCAFDLEAHRLDDSPLQENLRTFCTPYLAYGDDMQKIMRRLPSIRKLSCIFLDSWDDTRKCNRFPELVFLSQLESLKVLYDGKQIYPCEFNFPSNLKKLTLSNFCMPWNQISKLGKLCNLEVLKLLSRTFEGESWEMEDEEFPKLRFLKLDTLNLVRWSASAVPFPCLEHLALHRCEQLEEIPLVIGEIPTLQSIEVMWCNPSVAVSARNIQEEQLDYGNEALKIHVHPRLWEEELSS